MRVHGGKAGGVRSAGCDMDEHHLKIDTDTRSLGYVNVLDVLGHKAMDWPDLRLSETRLSFPCPFTSWNATGMLVT